MRILIATGLSPADVGGPAQYGERLSEEFQKLGHSTKIAQYGSIESALFSILPKILWADTVLALDTFSVGVPSILWARLLGKRVTVRIGGDFLWESYVQRTGEEITLNQFNSNIPKLNLKERIIFFFTKILTRFASQLAFNTKWQRDIWKQTYKIPEAKSFIIKNYIPKKVYTETLNKTFLWAGRKIKLKNLDLLEEVAKEAQVDLEVVSGLSYEKLQDKIKNSYAVVLPSFSEVCPNFVLEAISYNKPFIMTKETGLNELYNKGGIFIDPFDKKALKQAILSMSDPEQYSQHKKDLESLDVKHSWEDVANEFLSLYR